MPCQYSCKTDTTMQNQNSCLQTVDSNRMVMPAAYLCPQPQLVSRGAWVMGGLQCRMDTCNPMSTVQSHALDMLEETHPCKPIEPMLNRVTE